MTDYRKLKDEVSIIEIARSMGFHPYPVGHYYSLREHDSVRIDPGRNRFYRNSTGEHGSVIDFVMVFSGMGFREAVKEIEERTGLLKHAWSAGAASTVRKKKVLVLPEKGSTYRNMFAYLGKTRKLSWEVIREMVDKHQLYQDTKRNCVFVSYNDDGKPVFACRRGTSTRHRFVADVPGSDYTYGCFFAGNGQELLVCESVIDLMSYVTLKPEVKGYDRLALTGTGKKASLYFQMNQRRYRMLILALDSDEAGRKAAETIVCEVIKRNLIRREDIIVDLPVEKDWNEVLMKGGVGGDAIQD